MARLAIVALCVLVAVVVASETASAAITCDDVTSSIVPCLAYAIGSSTSPSAQCCDGVKSLNSRASSKDDRQTACNCLKNIAGQVAGVSTGNVASIPSKCGVSIGTPIDPNVDCSTIN